MFSSDGFYKTRNWFCILLIFSGLISVKIWLVAAQPLTVSGNSLHDEALFVRSADAILSGQWLGSYDNRTLIKGPFYPIWIAGMHVLGIPLLLAQHLLYSGACLVLVLAVRPLFSGWKVLLFIFIVLLFNPISFSGEVMPRVMREGIYPALTMLCIGGGIGLFLRSTGPMWKWTPWIIILTLALPGFWMTREEGIWILPGIGILFLGTLWQTIRFDSDNMQHGLRNRLLRCFFLACPILFFIFSLVLTAGLNWKYYGVFTLVEINSAPFSTAFAALGRVKNPYYERYVPLPEPLRNEIYAVSPAFAELRPHLEGALGQSWIEGVCNVARQIDNLDSNSPYRRYGVFVEPLCRDFGGGWFIWALRDAAALEGHHLNALAAKKFYHQLAEQIKKACDSGELECLPTVTTIIPVIRKNDWQYIVDSIFFIVRTLVQFSGFSVQSLPSSGSMKSSEIFSRVTGEHILSPDHEYMEDDVRIDLLGKIGIFFQQSGHIISIFAAAIWLILLFLLRQKLNVQFFLVTLSLLIAIATRVVMLGIIDALFFPTSSAQYLSSIYPLFLFWWCLVFIYFFVSIRSCWGKMII
jgi:hypothetical protein